MRRCRTTMQRGSTSAVAASTVPMAPSSAITSYPLMLLCDHESCRYLQISRCIMLIDPTS